MTISYLSDHLGQLAALAFVQTCSGLVEQHDARIGDDGTGDTDELDGAEGQRRGTLVEHDTESEIIDH